MSVLLTLNEYTDLIKKLATAWSIPDTSMALECFTEDAIYMEPPNIQLYHGHSQLKPYFDALTSGFYLKLHNIWFDEIKQIGSTEYSFGVKGRDICDTGVVITEIHQGKIGIWREYQQKGPADFQKFIGIDNKEWKWHIGNYP